MRITNNIIPVSYTHLDVYKRQGYDYTYDADVGKYLDLHAYSGTYVTFDDADSLSENTGFQTVDWTNSVILDGVTCGELVGIPVTVIGNSDLEQKGSDARTTYQLADGMLQMNYTCLLYTS